VNYWANITCPYGTEEADLCIVLDVFGDYWFWPYWQRSFVTDRIQLSDDYPVDTLILRLLWPEGDFGAVHGLYFWGALLYPGTLTIIGDLDYVVFGYF